jgi:VCBS repeat-containing protein
MSSDVSIRPFSSNQAPHFGKLLFEDNFDASILSPEWQTVEPFQWLANGWLHTRDTNGWPRDSMAVVHDGDKDWSDYVVTVTAGFSPGTPWDFINIPLRVDGFRRSSNDHRGTAYELELYGHNGWGLNDWDTITLSRSGSSAGSSTQLFKGKWNSSVSPARIRASLSGGHIEISINGERIIDLVDPAPLLYGGVGVHAIWESEAQFDNLIVTSLSNNTKFQLQENSALGMEVGTLTATDADAGDTLTYAITAGNSDPDADGKPAFAIDATSGTILVNDSDDLNYEATPAFNLSVNVTDQGGLFDSIAITINPTDANDSPRATDDDGIGYQTNENSTFTTANVLINDTDPDGNSLYISSIDTRDTKGVVTQNSDATFNYNPNNKFSSLRSGEQATDSFTYTVSDGRGGTDTGRVILTIHGVNQAPRFDGKTPVLWNRLGNADEVLNSEVGYDFETRSGVTFVNGVFGQALATQGGENGGGGYLSIKPDQFFPTDRTRGAVEVWMEKRIQRFIPYQTPLVGIFGNQPYAFDGSAVSIGAFWSDGLTGSGGIEFSITDNQGKAHKVNDLGWDDIAVGEWVHLGFAWDLAGIEGTTDKIRLYRNGSLMSANQDSISSIKGDTGQLIVLGHHAYSRFGQPTAYLDNLKVWDFAKTEFSDRFVEGINYPHTFMLAENSLTGIPIGTIIATDSDAGDTLTYAITAGNSDPDGDSQPAFAINSSTGVISVNDSGDLDFETTASFPLQVTATDAGGLSDTAPVSITLTNLAEPGNDRPEAQDATFSLPENSAEGTAVGTITASDFDPGDSLTYAMTAGNSDPDADGKPAFAIDATSGALTINDRGDFNFETTPEFRLQVMATDTAGLSATASISVNLININDAPLAADKTVRVAKNTSYTMKANDFGFSDVNDSPPNTLLAVKITALPEQGALTNKGIPLSAQQSVPLADIMAGRFVFTPVSDTSGNKYASFDFQVQDNGGIANGGVDISLLPNRMTIDVTAGGSSWGDPHIRSFDGQYYDFQATGDFLLARALDSELEIQVRQRPWSLNPETTLNLGLATRMDGNDVCFDLIQPYPLVNGRPFEIARTETRLVGQGTLSRSDSNPNNTQQDLYTITYSNGDQLAVEILHDLCINPTVYLISSREVIGLLGNNNGQAEDDLALRDGTVSSQPLAPEYLHGDFAASWHVNASESLFDRQYDYDPVTYIPLDSDGLAASRLSTMASETDSVVNQQVHLSDVALCCTGTMEASLTILPSILDSLNSGTGLAALDALGSPACSGDHLNGNPQHAYGFGI